MVKSQPHLRYFWQSLIAVTLASVLSACSTPGIPRTDTAEKHDVSNQQQGYLLQASQDEFEQLVKNVDVKSRILNQYASWKGVRYRLGGDTRRGIDCSAFVQRTFREQFGIDLPRSTYEQKTTGHYIARNKLRVGDLVLFRSGSTGRHIGIYLGNDKFVHASTSSGVMISSLNENYWKKRYREGRRIIGTQYQS